MSHRARPAPNAFRDRISPPAPGHLLLARTDPGGAAATSACTAWWDVWVTRPAWRGRGLTTTALIGWPGSGSGSPRRSCQSGRARPRRSPRCRRCCICTGCRAGDLVPALGQFPGSAAGLPAAAITRLNGQWEAEQRATSPSRTARSECGRRWPGAWPWSNWPRRRPCAQTPGAGRAAGGVARPGAPRCPRGLLREPVPLSSMASNLHPPL